MVFVVGAGPAGLSTAITLKRNGIPVIVFEKMASIGKKIIVSGNGRANLSNKNINETAYNNQEFARKVIDLVSVDDLVSFFSSIGLCVKFDNKGLMYPFNENAKSVAELLLLEARHLGIEIKTNTNIDDISYQDGFWIDNMKADYLVIACGGKSQSIYGSSGDGYFFAKKFGHHINELKPSLCPVYSSDNLIKGLEGLRIKCQVMVNDFKEDGELLFKNDGISGIVVFNMVSYLNKNKLFCPTIYLNLIGEYDPQFLFENSWKYLDSCLTGLLDKRLAMNIIKYSGIKKKFINELSLEEKNKLISLLKALPIKLDKTYDFSHSQVTSGGVPLSEIKDSLESKKLDKLYFAGEVLDIDGPCGGYNMHMAFSTGIICGRSIVNDINRQH